MKTIDNFSAVPARSSPKVTPEMAFAILALLAKGMMQHRIAALLGINQGRISEVKNGKLFPELARRWRTAASRRRPRNR